MSTRHNPNGWLFTAIRLLCAVALFFASMLAVDYYFASNTFCAEGAACQTVAQSDFGQKYGIFLPVLGLTVYSLFFLFSFWMGRTRLKLFTKSLSRFWYPLAIICSAMGAFLFIIVQTFEIHAFCYMCMGIDTSAILMCIPAVLLMRSKSDDEENGENVELKSDRSGKTILHPVLWLTLYFIAACGPIAYGTRNADEPVAAPASENGGVVVPDYIQSFYVPGKINVVEISSFECPHCRQLHPEFNKLLLEYGERVNFTRLTIPLRGRKEACVAYFCAEKQKKEAEFADCQFEEPSTDTEKILEHARHCSINEDAFKSCLTDPQSATAVDEILKNIQSTGFEGAPTVWIDDAKIVGFNKKNGMQPYRDAIEKNKGAAQTKGSAAAITAHHVSLIGLILAVLSLLGGIPLTMMRRRDDKAEGWLAAEDVLENDSEKENG